MFCRVPPLLPRRLPFHLPLFPVNVVFLPRSRVYNDHPGGSGRFYTGLGRYFDYKFSRRHQVVRFDTNKGAHSVAYSVSYAILPRALVLTLCIMLVFDVNELRRFVICVRRRGWPDPRLNQRRRDGVHVHFLHLHAANHCAGAVPVPDVLWQQTRTFHQQREGI